MILTEVEIVLLKFMNDAKHKGATKITLNDSVETYEHPIFLSNNTIFLVVYECYALLKVS